MATVRKIFFSNTESVLPRTIDFSQPVFLYFSAVWCTFSHISTMKLIDFYIESNKSNKKIEIIFASLDSDLKSFDSYFKHMPWLALKYDTPDLMEAFLMTYRVDQIPMLIQINRRFVNLRNDCMDIILNNPSEAYEIFLKTLKEPITK